MELAQRILQLARQEIGVREDPPGSSNVKYNTAYYGGRVNGSQFDWCAVFVWWLFRQAEAEELYFDGEKTAYVPALLSWGRKKGLLVKTPRPGDLICFDFDGNGSPNHVGICESVDAERVTTIDGNTGSGKNSGSVMRRTRKKQYILGVIRPEYEKEETMTQEQFDAMMADYLKRLAQKEPSNWSEEARRWAEENEVISGDEQGNKQYKKFCTREEMIQLLYNAEKQ